MQTPYGSINDNSNAGDRSAKNISTEQVHHPRIFSMTRRRMAEMLDSFQTTFIRPYRSNPYPHPRTSLSLPTDEDSIGSPQDNVEPLDLSIPQRGFAVMAPTIAETRAADEERRPTTEHNTQPIAMPGIMGSQSYNAWVPNCHYPRSNFPSLSPVGASNLSFNNIGTRGFHHTQHSPASPSTSSISPFLVEPPFAPMGHRFGSNEDITLSNGSLADTNPTRPYFRTNAMPDLSTLIQPSTSQYTTYTSAVDMVAAMQPTFNTTFSDLFPTQPLTRATAKLSQRVRSRRSAFSRRRPQDQKAGAKDSVDPASAASPSTSSVLVEPQPPKPFVSNEDPTLSNGDPADSTSIPPKPTRSRKRPIPEEFKDEEYRKKRKKNNEAAKRSRESKKRKDEETVSKAKFLQQENNMLRLQLASAMREIENYRRVMYSRHVVCRECLVARRPNRDSDSDGTMSI